MSIRTNFNRQIEVDLVFQGFNRFLCEEETQTLPKPFFFCY